MMRDNTLIFRISCGLVDAASLIRVFELLHWDSKLVKAGTAMGRYHEPDAGGAAAFMVLRHF